MEGLNFFSKEAYNLFQLLHESAARGETLALIVKDFPFYLYFNRTFVTSSKFSKFETEIFFDSH